MRIPLGRLHLRMAQQLADHFQGCTTADQEGRESVAQIVDPHIGQVRVPLDVDPEAADFLHGLSGRVAGKQPRHTAWHQQLALAYDIEVAQEVLAETQSAILPLVPYLDTLRWVFIAVALIGIAVAIHARIDDWKRGQR
jgi:hypothetical protein